jgi:iron complex transport system ATP-binding protein
MTDLVVEGLDVNLEARPILRGVGFAARAGELIGLIGPNGAGKTTLLRAIGQLTPARAGTASWDGRPLRALDDRERARTLAYLPQGHAIHWPLTVRRLVGLGRLPRLGPFGRATAQDEQAVERAMAAADVLALADRLTSTLSGGERARALLARALAVEAPVLLADEPTASLDPYHALEIMALLRRQADDGALVVVVMHDLGLVARFCDRVALIDQGRLVCEGPPRDALTPARLREVYRIEAASAPDAASAFAASLATATRTG